MHAASVHPEPGSNSQTICISSALAVRFFVWAIYLSFFYFLELCSLLLVFDRSVFRTCFILLCTSIFCCSIVKVQFRTLCERLTIISHLNRFVNRFFEFFSIFFGELLSYDIQFSAAVLRQLHYSTTFLNFCQLLFPFFFHFVYSFNFNNFYIPFLCISTFSYLNFGGFQLNRAVFSINRTALD